MSNVNQKLSIVSFIVIFAMMVDIFFPKVVVAGSSVPDFVNLGQSEFVDEVFNFSEVRLTRADDKKPRRVIYVIVTAYSSTPDQTDNSPFITANGTWVHDGTLAANFLPFGTKVRLPDYSGDKIYTVEDRMNQRYWYRADIWMSTREAAKQFGVKRLRMEIY